MICCSVIVLLLSAGPINIFRVTVCLFIHPYFAVLGRTVSAVTRIIAIAHAAVETAASSGGENNSTIRRQSLFTRYSIQSNKLRI